MKKHNLIRGFTLIEMLVVIAIIAILTGIILVSISGARAKARDGKRISDVSQIQLALEQYFDRCGQYPRTGFMTGANLSSYSEGCPTTPTQISLATFISSIPVPPTGATPSQANYAYAVNYSVLPTDYVIGVTLENNSSMPQGGGITSPNPTYGLTCDTTKNYCVGPK